MSQSNNKLSLFAAIIINVNIMTGAGLFINSVELAKRAGGFGALGYAVVGLLLFPLVLSFVKLAQLHPTGGFFAFSAQSVHPVVGFLSTWSYFIAKISSATLVIHVFATIMQRIFPVFADVTTLALDIVILGIILGLNMFNVRTGSTIQNWLMIIKLMPIFFVIFSGFFFLQGAHFLPVEYIWSGVPYAVPLVLHAMLGFEAACSISRNLRNPEVDGPRAVLFSYLIVVCLYIAYQAMFYSSLGEMLAQQINYSSAFVSLIDKYLLSQSMRTMFTHLIYIAIATSAVSAAFGTIYTNMWNVFALAERGHTFVPAFVTKLNSYGIPFVCVLLEGLISVLYMCMICGDQVTFQQLSALGSTVNYSLCTFGLFATLYKSGKSVVLPALALINSAILLSASFYTMWWSNNAMPLYMYGGLATFALVMFYWSSKD